MQYTNPTTQSEMYTALKEIFFYYRIKRQSFEKISLQPLDLERLQFTPKTDSELSSKAQILNSAEQYSFKTQYIDEINQEIFEINQKMNDLQPAKQEKIAKVNSDFDESVKKLNSLLAKNGLTGSSIAIDKIAQMEVEKNKLLAEIESQYQSDMSSLNSKIGHLNQRLNNANSFCSQKAQKENEAKLSELKDEQEKSKREIFKYNNGLDEKEQRYANSILQINASLELRFLSIQAGEFTKDQLIEMGYYEDVINCVCAYYDTLSVAVAANQIMRDKKLIEYLDDYYESVVYMYQQRALA